LPKLRRPFRKIALQRVERNSKCAALSCWPQPGINFVQPAEWTKLVANSNQPLTKLAEEMAVDRAILPSPAWGGVGGGATAASLRMAAGFKQKDQIKIAVIVWLAPAKFAQRQDDRLTYVAFAFCKVIAEPLHDCILQL